MISFAARARNRAKFEYYKIYATLKRQTAVKHKGMTMFAMNTSTPETTHRALNFSLREPETIAWIDRFTGDSPVLYDVGANVGIYSLYCKSVHARSNVFCFEPESQSFADLCRNIYINEFTNITPYQIAISDSEGLDTLSVSVMSAGAGAAALGMDYVFQAPRHGSSAFLQGVFHTSIDGLWGERGLPPPNYLKIDVDGIEPAILDGASKTLADSALRGLLVEFQYRDESELRPMIERLAGLGLEFVESSTWSTVAKGLMSRNFLFARRTAT